MQYNLLFNIFQVIKSLKLSSDFMKRAFSALQERDSHVIKLQSLAMISYNYQPKAESNKGDSIRAKP